MNYRDSDWYAAIKDRPIGTRLRMVHEGCSTGEALIVTKQDSGVSAYCFRCKWNGFVGAPPESLAQKLERKAREKLADEVMTSDNALPSPKTEDPSEWPLRDRVWLYRAGLNNADILRLGIYYHRASGRVVLPVYSLGKKVVYWQARTQDADKPKYKNPTNVNRKTLAARWGGSSDVLVLVEDYLSSYRVHRATGHSVYSLLGTSLSKEIAAEIIQSKKSVVVYLDPDNAGVTASRKIVGTLRAYGVNVRSVCSDRDPKLLSDREIREVIDEVSLYRP